MRILQDILDKAIVGRQLIVFDYHEKLRIVEPYHYGLLGSKYQLHGFQTQGESISGGIPEWRNYQLSLIANLTIEPNSNFDIRASYRPATSEYSLIEKSVLIHNKNELKT